MRKFTATPKTLAAVAVVLAVGGVGAGVATATTVFAGSEHTESAVVDTPEPGDTPDHPGQVDTPEPGDTPDQPGAADR